MLLCLPRSMHHTARPGAGRPPCQLPQARALPRLPSPRPREVQALREQIVPSARAYPLEALMADCQEYFRCALLCLDDAWEAPLQDVCLGA